MSQRRSESRIACEIDDRAARTRAVVVGSPNDKLEAGLATGRGAHRAGFEGDVEGAVFEPPIAELMPGGGEDDQLGVGAGVSELAAPVAGAGDDRAGTRHDGADRYLTAVGGSLRLGQSHGHEATVVVVENPVREHRSRLAKRAQNRGPFCVFEMRVVYFTSTRSPTSSGAQARVMRAVA
jgi:hypothetical protein